LSNFHALAKGTPGWSVNSLAKISPTHPLVLAVNKGNSQQQPPDNQSTQVPPSQGMATTADSTAASSLTSMAQAQTTLAAFERSVKSDEARKVVDELKSAMGLN
jgi:hypothetical protein